jgi:hypothetical protein
MPRDAAVTVPNSSALPSAIQRADLERFAARAGDDQHAEKADDQRDPARRADRLLQNTSEASVANSGAEKLIAVALASGIMLNAISSRSAR